MLLATNHSRPFSSEGGHKFRINSRTVSALISKMRIFSNTSLALFTISSCSAFSAFSVKPQSRNSCALNMANPGKSVFLTPESAKACIELAGSPLYAYSLEKLEETADACLAFPNAFGLTVRYAMKASPNSSILKYFNSRGIHIDASSGFEARRAMSSGIPAENISLSTQELPADFAELVKMGVKVNAWYVSLTRSKNSKCNNSRCTHIFSMSLQLRFPARALR